jgi:ketosteroid isomerase-like protein
MDMTTTDSVRTWLTGFDDVPFDYETRDLEFAVGGEVAYAYYLSGMGLPGAFSLWLRTTFGLRKNAGDWWITHIQASTPFYMDETSNAALDQAP